MKEYLKKWLGIKQLERDYFILLSNVKDLLNKTSDLSIGEEVIPNSKLEFILGAISAFEKKLGKVTWELKEDPIQPMKETRYIRSWSVYKKKVK